MAKQVSEVFGIAQRVRSDSYVDRSNLDQELEKLLSRDLHIAVRGASKSGKSWLRQTVAPDALTIQCRHMTTTVDIYKDALAQLGIELQVDRTQSESSKMSVTAQGEAGFKLLAKVSASLAGETQDSQTTRHESVGHEVGNVALIADILQASGLRIIVEDFHYLSITERQKLAFDLKLFWDVGLFVMIIGVWTQPNLLLTLNPDLRGRLREVVVDWSDEDLARILREGGKALGIEFGGDTERAMVAISYSNPGVLQALALAFLDELGISVGFTSPVRLDNLQMVENAAMGYAYQLEPYYGEWAKRLSAGIRQRKNATGIYAHALAVILEAEDAALLKGLDRKAIHEQITAREPRIQAGNLRTALRKFESIQVDTEGRGLVLGYHDEPGRVVVIDREILLYRKFTTSRWPWDEMASEYAEHLMSDVEEDS